MTGNKRRVLVATYHRDELSLGENRQQLGYSAYHWGIIIIPKQGTGDWVFDVTNGVRLSPGPNSTDLNPNRNFYYRSRSDVDREKSSHLLGMAMIGKLPPGTSFADVDNILSQVHVPQLDAEPRESCVTWTRSAIEILIKNGLAEDLTTQRILDQSIALADKVMKGRTEPRTIENLTTRPL